jgi:hypothetical protein
MRTHGTYVLPMASMSFRSRSRAALNSGPTMPNRSRCCGADTLTSPVHSRVGRSHGALPRLRGRGEQGELRSKLCLYLRSMP